MAWTTPRTWVAGAKLLAAQLNEQVRDNEDYLKSHVDTLEETVESYVQNGMVYIAGTTFAGTIPGGGTTTISDINQAYSNLKVICSLNCGGTIGQLQIIVNNDFTKTNYESHNIHFYNSSTTLQDIGNSTYPGLHLNAILSSPDYGYPASAEFTIMNYSSDSMYKFSTLNPTGYYAYSHHLFISRCLYKSNTPITSLAFSFILNNITTILPGSKIGIYGMK